jgi:prepilin-type N-terminal cleavage/methylation domain-containing protein
MLKILKSKNEGYTLIEVIVTLAIASIVLVAIGNYFVNNMRFNAMAQDEVYIQDQVRRAMKGISNLAMEKKSVTVSAGPPYTVTFNGGELTFKLLANGDLTYDMGSGEQVFAKNIEIFTVDLLEPKLLEITIKGKKDRAEFQVVDSVFLRN